jgi:hypothetical protein
MLEFFWKLRNADEQTISKIFKLGAPLGGIILIIASIGDVGAFWTAGLQISGAAIVFATSLLGMQQKNLQRARWKRLSQTNLSFSPGTFNKCRAALLRHGELSQVKTLRFRPPVITPASSEMSFSKLVEFAFPMHASADQLALTDTLRRRYQSKIQEWDKNSNLPCIRMNSPHAIAFASSVLDAQPSDNPQIEYLPSDYVVWKVLQELVWQQDEAGFEVRYPRVIGAGGFLVDPFRNELIFQLRSNRNDFGGGLLHCFGGNFEPNLSISGHSPDRNLIANAEREILEESSVAVSVDGTVCIWHDELAQPAFANRPIPLYYPVHYCGIVLSSEQCGRLHGTTEGEIMRIGFHELQEYLAEPQKWMPTAHSTAMAWLSIGAPCSFGQPIFNKTKAIEMYANLIE